MREFTRSGYNGGAICQKLLDLAVLTVVNGNNWGRAFIFLNNSFYCNYNLTHPRRKVKISIGKRVFSITF
uniref:Uncharacterized protein n=1 Tax=Heterorhabditis bacteriophora TaxID=37862 RepID=A0A1I7WGN3_HETBA